MSGNGKGTLFERMARVTQTHPGIPRTEKSQRGNAYASHYMVTAMIQKVLPAHGLQFVPEIVDVQDLNGGVRVHMLMTLYCTDTDESKSWKWVSESALGVSDRVQSATSVACKFFLTKTFMISDPSEPDQEDGKPGPTEPQPSLKERVKKRTQGRQDPKELMEELGKEPPTRELAMIERAETVKDLELVGGKLRNVALYGQQHEIVKDAYRAKRAKLQQAAKAAAAAAAAVYGE